VVLQQQYREKGFKKYAELISCLLVAEQNNELLMKNHEARPTGSAPFPEVNAAKYDKSNNFRGRGHGRGLGRGRGHGRERGQNYRDGHKNANKQENNKGSQDGSSKNKENKCYRCGMKGHWSRVCRTPEHFVKLYQASIKKGKNVEANMTLHNDDVEANKHNNVEVNLAYKEDDYEGFDDITHLDVADYLQ